VSVAVATKDTARARIGRPPDTDPAHTRRRILDAARHEFAHRGYAAAMLRFVAAAATLTTGAVYHHYASKADLYLAVHADAHDLVYERFRLAVRDGSSFVEMVDAMLDAAAEMNQEDPTLATFIAAARVDRRRHTELAELLPDDRVRRSRFFRTLLDAGTRSGEITGDERAQMEAFLHAAVVGLNDGASDDAARQRATINAIKAAVRGLVHTTQHD
jgi:AcrR family transcriptional regulator